MASQGWSVDSFLDGEAPRETSRLTVMVDWVVAVCVGSTLLTFAADWQHGPLYFKWLPVAALALAGLVMLNLAGRVRTLRFDAVDGFALLLLIWVGISLAWSPNTLGGRDVLIKWSLLTAAFIGLRHSFTPDTYKRIATAIAIGILGIIAMDRLRIAQSGGYFNQNYQTEAILLGLPFLLVFNTRRVAPWLRWGTRLLALGAVLFLIFFNPSKIEFLVWAGSGMFFALALLWNRSKLQALTALCLLVAGTALLAFIGWDRPLFGESHGFRESILPRLELAANGFAIWRDALLFGHGAGFMYPTYPLYQERHLQLFGIAPNNAVLTGFYTSAGALHNDYIQFLAGFGLVGLAIVAAAAYTARNHLRQWHQSASRIAGTGVTVACLTTATVDFPLQNAASAMLAVLGLAWLLAEDRIPAITTATAQTHTRFRIPALILSIAAFPAVSWWGYRYYIGHDAYGAAQRLGPTRPDVSLQLNLGAVGAYPFDDAFRYQLYPTLMFIEENSSRPVAPPETHDQIFEAGLTAGPGNALMIFRLEYLLNSGRYKERQEEVSKWRKQLTTNVTRLPDTWLMEGLYEVADNRPDKAKAALDRYLELTGGVVSDDRKGIVESIRRAIAR